MLVECRAALVALALPGEPARSLPRRNLERRGTMLPSLRQGCSTCSWVVAGGLVQWFFPRRRPSGVLHRVSDGFVPLSLARGSCVRPGVGVPRCLGRNRNRKTEKCIHNSSRGMPKTERASFQNRAATHKLHQRKNRPDQLRNQN